MADLVTAPNETPLLKAVNEQRARIVGFESDDVSSKDHQALFPHLRALHRLWARILDRRGPRNATGSIARDGETIASKTRKAAMARSRRAVNDKVQSGTATPDDLTTSLHLFSFKSSLLCGSDQPPSPTEPFKQQWFPASRKRRRNGDLTADDLLSNCIICDDELLFEEVIKAPCCHSYCKGCIRELFEASFIDESLFRPKCCTEDIPVVLLQDFLTQQQRDTYLIRDIQVKTKDRTYCSNGKCATFIIPPTVTANVATCTKCKTRTCSLCKNPAHEGPCKKDEAMQQTLELVEREGWRKCPVCTRLVELKHGCNHVNCLCGKHWCYVCLAPWKQCDCPKWTRSKLRERAEIVVARKLPKPKPAPRHSYGNAPVYQPRQPKAERRGKADYQRRVEQEMEYLEKNHECNHARWDRVGGPHRCEQCHYRLPYFILECRQCRLRACVRCRQNRVLV